jgi:hypothetical protein
VATIAFFESEKGAKHGLIESTDIQNVAIDENASELDL